MPALEVGSGDDVWMVSGYRAEESFLPVVEVVHQTKIYTSRTAVWLESPIWPDPYSASIFIATRSSLAPGGP